MVKNQIITGWILVAEGWEFNLEGQSSSNKNHINPHFLIRSGCSDQHVVGLSVFSNFPDQILYRTMEYICDC